MLQKFLECRTFSSELDLRACLARHEQQSCLLDVHDLLLTLVEAASALY